MGLDWTGNKKSTFVQLGASNHSNKEREQNDFYATDPKSLEIFLEKLDEDKIYLHKNIWECACGKGHLSKVLEEKGYNVHSTDIVDRGYGIGNVDFLKQDTSFEGDILTNPPFKYAEKFVEKSMSLLKDNYYLILFLKIQFLEGQARKEMFKKYPPKYIYVNSKRQLCAMNGEFEKYNATAICYCWFIWQKSWKGETVIRWI